jgi:hypothetical protein
MVSELCRDARAAGYTVICSEILPHDGQAVARREFNADMEAGWSSIASGIVRDAEDPLIGDNGGPDAANNNHNTTYYQADHVHPTAAGAAIIAKDVASAINRL